MYKFTNKTTKEQLDDYLSIEGIELEEFSKNAFSFNSHNFFHYKVLLTKIDNAENPENSVIIFNMKCEDRPPEIGWWVTFEADANNIIIRKAEQNGKVYSHERYLKKYLQLCILAHSIYKFQIT